MVCFWYALVHFRMILYAFIRFQTLSNASKCSHTLPVRFPYASHTLPIRFHTLLLRFYMLLHALEAKVSPQEQARWSLVYRLLPAEAGKKAVLSLPLHCCEYCCYVCNERLILLSLTILPDLLSTFEDSYIFCFLLTPLL